MTVFRAALDGLGGLTFAHPGRVHLVWLAIGLGVLLFWLEARGRDVLARFVSTVMQERLARRPSRARKLARVAIVFVGVVLAIGALMRPQTPLARTVVENKGGADLMVVIDVSKSMLAEDAAPNRLERAKAELADMVDKLGGNRLGLIAFAGRASVLCPLTSDHGFFKMILRTVTMASVTRGGTRIGDAIRKAKDTFPPGGQPKLIVLITDGEDHDSYPLEAAKEAKEDGVRIVAIGFGDEKGSQISLTDPATGAKSTLADRDGNPVVSRLDGETLRQIALATEGVYVPAGVAVLDLESILRTNLEPLLGAGSTLEVRMVKEERYPWFVLGALVCLVISVAVERAPKRKELP